MDKIGTQSLISAALGILLALWVGPYTTPGFIVLGLAGMIVSLLILRLLARIF
jgi:hypothetical protein